MSDDLEGLVKALQRKLNYQVERIDELEETVENVGARVGEMQEVVNPDPGSRTYEELTKDQKVHKVRKKLLSLAMNSNGVASMKYRDVKTMFDGYPSDGHCYDLMELAGQKEGFSYTKNKGGEKVLRVKAPDVNDEALIHAVNNAPSENPA